MKLAYLVEHPIQYQAPLFRALAERPGITFEVLFCHDHGIRSSYDSGFSRHVRFDVPLTEGFKHKFMHNVSPRPAASFFGRINPEIASLIMHPRHDVIVLHGYGRATNLVSLLLPRGNWPKLLLRGDSNARAPLSRIKSIAKRAVIHPLFRRIDRFVSIGSRNTEYYSMYGVPSGRISFAPYAVDNSYFRDRSEAARLNPERARLDRGLPPNTPLFLYCGKLVSWKRPQDAIQALAIARKNVACALAVAGDGVLRAELEAQVRALGLEADVFFVGFQNQSELPSLYGACDALVLPSEREPWGLVVNEAMACGLAIIVSEEVGAAPDLVSSDNGAIVAKGDIPAFAEAMIRIARDQNLRKRMKAASAARIERWDVPASADGIIAAARAAIGQPGL